MNAMTLWQNTWVLCLPTSRILLPSMALGILPWQSMLDSLRVFQLGWQFLGSSLMMALSSKWAMLSSVSGMPNELRSLLQSFFFMDKFCRDSRITQLRHICNMHVVSRLETRMLYYSTLKVMSAVRGALQVSPWKFVILSPPPSEQCDPLKYLMDGKTLGWWMKQ